jgi:hypothetical protein
MFFTAREIPKRFSGKPEREFGEEPFPRFFQKTVFQRFFTAMKNLSVKIF